MEGGWRGEGRSKRSGRSGRACTGALESHLIGSRGIEPGDHGARSHKVGVWPSETLGAMAPGAMGPWRHGSIGGMGVEGHGGRVERGKMEA